MSTMAISKPLRKSAIRAFLGSVGVQCNIRFPFSAGLGGAFEVPLQQRCLIAGVERARALEREHGDDHLNSETRVSHELFSADFLPQ